MLPKINRLKKKKDFEKVFRQGKGFKEDFFYLKVSKNNLGLVRFGLITSKKFSKKATERNKMRRRLSELIRKKLPKIKKGTDVVIIAIPGAEADFKKLEDIISKLFKKAQILNG